MRETRLSGSEGGAGSIPVPTPIVARAFQPVGLGRAVRSARRPSSAVSHPFSVLRPLRSLLSEILPCVPSIPWAAQRVTLRPAIRGRPDMGWKNPPPSDHSVPSCQKFFRVFRVFRGPTLRPPPSCICLPVIHPILAPFAPLRGQPSALCPRQLLRPPFTPFPPVKNPSVCSVYSVGQPSALRRPASAFPSSRFAPFLCPPFRPPFTSCREAVDVLR